jgi:hypothetical protein
MAPRCTPLLDLVNQQVTFLERGVSAARLLQADLALCGPLAWRLPRALCEQPLHAEVASTRIRPLDVEHLLEEGQRQLCGRRRVPLRPLVLQSGEPIVLERLEDMPDMLAGQAQAAGNTGLVLALIAHAHHRPAGAIGILELVEAGEG